MKKVKVSKESILNLFLVLNNAGIQISANVGPEFVLNGIALKI